MLRSLPLRPPVSAGHLKRRGFLAGGLALIGTLAGRHRLRLPGTRVAGGWLLRSDDV